jgi:FdrA protein
MTSVARVLAGRYTDSVVLMRLASALAARPGIEDAAAVMGTAANQALLAEGGFLADPAAAGPDDLVVAVKAESTDAAQDALDAIDELLETPRSSERFPAVRTLDEALARQPASNIAAISLPGEHAAAQARAALERGLHVFLFSSNVPLEQELELKREAMARGLLCMGPDCGTAIIDGVGLGFANAVRRGPVGIVGAAGTGIQSLTCVLDRFGVGISHAIGCGSRDLSDPVGGTTALAGLEALLGDDKTSAIVVISKPASPAVAARIRERAARARKPVILGFLGDTDSPSTIDELARLAAEAVGVTPPPLEAPSPPAVRTGWIRGLYSGGTLAYEAQLLLRDLGVETASNAPLPGAAALADASSWRNTILDLGSEELTRGRPHPMIDPRLRRERLLDELADPQVAVVLLDVVLGYAANPDPAADLADAIAAAGDALVFACVVGTERDPQGLHDQEGTLRHAGAVVFPTNAAMVRAAAAAVVAAPIEAVP